VWDHPSDQRVHAQDDDAERAAIFADARYVAACRMSTAFTAARVVRERVAHRRAQALAHGEYLRKVRAMRGGR